MPAVDVIVPTYNRHARLARTLTALSRQTVSEFRVFVADDGSTPPVSTMVAACAPSLDVEVLTLTGNSGPAAARNAAVAAGTGELLLFADDDVDPGPEWCERHLDCYARSGPGTVVIGPLLAPLDWRPTPWNRWEANKLAIEYARMSEGVYEPTWRQLFTGNALIARRDFERAGGFDERFTRAEDIELGVRLEALGARFVFNPEAVGWHHAERSLGAWLRLPGEYARFDVAIDRLHPRLRWLETITEELAGRNVVTRLASKLPAGLSLPAATHAARVLDARGAHRPAGAALSFAWDVRYRAALAATLAAPGLPLGREVAAAH
jgi:GT2 family glycosyltransferase